MRDWADNDEPDSLAVRMEFGVLLALMILGFIIAIFELVRAL